jgi:hypothetical protein
MAKRKLSISSIASLDSFNKRVVRRSGSSSGITSVSDMWSIESNKHIPDFFEYLFDKTPINASVGGFCNSFTAVNMAAVIIKNIDSVGVVLSPVNINVGDKDSVSLPSTIGIDTPVKLRKSTLAWSASIVYSGTLRHTIHADTDSLYSMIRVKIFDTCNRKHHWAIVVINKAYRNASVILPDRTYTLDSFSLIKKMILEAVPYKPKDVIFVNLAKVPKKLEDINRDALNVLLFMLSIRYGVSAVRAGASHLLKVALKRSLEDPIGKDPINSHVANTERVDALKNKVNRVMKIFINNEYNFE